MTLRAAPKPTPAVKEPKRLSSRPRPVDPRAARETYERDGWLCQWCRRPGGRLLPHHRLRRSQGGKDEPRYLVSVHTTCHDEIHFRQVATAKRRGFLVSRVEDLDKGWT